LEPIESEDSGSYDGGLADVLEPDFDDEAVTSLHMTGANPVGPHSIRMPPASVRNGGGPLSVRGSSGGPISVRGGGGPISVRGGGPVSVRGGGPISDRPRAPSQVQDFAFADTVFGLPEEASPPSSPIYVNDDPGQSQSMTPHSYPLPEESAGRGGFGVLADAFQRSREEMRELWAGTGEMVDESRGMRTIRRVFALWSCFQWSRADLTRAAMIGLAVFVTAAAIGATTIDFGSESSVGSAGVRAARTLDQHTGKKVVLRTKR
jgi:hypothetical protein